MITTRTGGSTVFKSQNRSGRRVRPIRAAEAVLISRRWETSVGGESGRFGQQIPGSWFPIPGLPRWGSAVGLPAICRRFRHAVQGWFRSLEQPREDRWGTLPTPCRRGVGRQAGPIARAFGRRGGEKKICNLRRISVCISAGMIKCARSDELRSNAELPTGNQNGKALTTDGAAAALMRMRRTHGR